ncbi:MAG: cytochrome B [Legionellales bacterium RIFCSPHIGHO2_12_FULL_42_9]|nr:MAG: cytochrome B [Legionellales bacterium RIFCSPHIGHO2_12_FULL_42_9]
MSSLLQWLDDRFPLVSTWKKHASEYYVPKNLNFFYYFGFLLLFVLCNQLITGLWLTMFYTPSADRAFDSVQYIMRDVNFGWLLRYLHSTGASLIFVASYIHLFKGLLYGSYQKPRELVWLLGTGLLVLLLIEAFFGYLLPWGQMSYWGAQVITSLFSVIPYIGEGLTSWIRGDYQVSNATLQRFFAFHVVGIPLLLLFFILLHLVSLRQVGSNNPEGIEIKKHLNKQGNPLDGLPFHPYYTSKDFVGLLVFLIVFFSIVFFAPEMGGCFLEVENLVAANPLVTPEHITPVWYTAPFYTMLRVIPDKLSGVITMSCAILILFFIPWLDQSPVRSMRYKGKFSIVALSLFSVSFILLGFLGTVRITPARLCVARICTAIYFAYFILMPIYSRFEKHKTVPDRILDK